MLNEKRIWLLVFVLLIIVASGCMSLPRYEFVKPNVTPEQAKLDILDCKFKAEAAMVSSGDGVLMYAYNLAKLQNLCMQAKGYYKQQTMSREDKQFWQARAPQDPEKSGYKKEGNLWIKDGPR